jgi:uncharacterized protein
MLNRGILVTLLPVVINCAAAHAQSFDCGKAADAVDRAICNTPELSTLDTRLGAAWQSFRTHYPDLVPQAHKDGVVWYKTRKMCAQREDMIGCIRDAEAARIQQLDAAAVSSGSATGTTVPLATDVSSDRERIWFGEHIGESAYVIAKEGIGTANASIQILLDWDREVRACSDEYLTYEGNEPNKDGYDRCLEYSKTHFNSPRIAMARANCQTGEMLSFFQTRPRSYAGRITQAVQANLRLGTKEGTYFNHIFNYEGFEVGDYGYTNVSPDGEVFRKLCPTSFTAPPKTRLPELDLMFDCKAGLEQAARLAAASDRLRVIGSRIVNVSDVKTQGTTWYEAKCSAQITLSNGEKATLEYEKIPRNGKYYVKIEVVQ